MRALADVAPSAEQLTLISRVKPGVEVIRGAAGSGKTTTAILKLKASLGFALSRKRRQRREEPLRVLVLTYNRTLRGYIKELIKKQFSQNGEISLDIRTFGKWAKDMTGAHKIVDSVKDIVPKGVLAGMPTDFLLNEAEYALGRFLPDDMPNYLTARRDGRGGTPRMERPQRQALIDTVLEPYKAGKAKSRTVDWNDLAVELATKKVAAYDIVIVDEAQDFSANQIRAVMNQLMDVNSVTFVLDTAQRIYARGFTWQEVNISIRPENSFRLSQNYRNTKQIAQFAAALVDGLTNDDDGTLPDFSSATRTGPKPLVIRGKFRQQMACAIDYIIKNIDLTSESVAFLHPLGGGYFRYHRSSLQAARLAFIEITRESEWPEGSENIALSTLHSAKGLEFDHVFILGLNAEVLVHGDGDEDSQLHTIRRLLAMGAGRAKKTLMLGYKDDDAPHVVKYFGPGTFDPVVL